MVTQNRILFARLRLIAFFIILFHVRNSGLPSQRRGLYVLIFSKAYQSLHGNNATVVCVRFGVLRRGGIKLMTPWKRIQPRTQPQRLETPRTDHRRIGAFGQCLCPLHRTHAGVKISGKSGAAITASAATWPCASMNISPNTAPAGYSPAKTTGRASSARRIPAGYGKPLPAKRPGGAFHRRGATVISPRIFCLSARMLRTRRAAKPSAP